MTVLRLTPAFVAWLAERGLTPDDLNSPPIAFAYVALFEKYREIAREEGAAS